MTQNIPKGILTYMTTRTDVHSPKNLVTEDYEYVFAFDRETPWALGFRDTDGGRAFLREMNEGIQRSPMAKRGMGQCHHCGAHLRYVAILKHVPSGCMIAVGETCLENRFERATADFHALRKAAELDRAKMRIKTAAAEFVASLSGDVKIALDRETVLTEAFPFLVAGEYTDYTIRDIRRKVWDLYGNASERQVAFVAKLISEARDRAANAARIAAERASEVRVDAPEGRVAFEGLVVTRKWRDSDFGGAYKLTVKIDDAERGGIWLAWVSEPSKFECERGDIIQMTATLTRSSKDASFAFGKRPAKFSVISSGNAVPENIDFPDSLA